MDRARRTIVWESTNRQEERDSDRRERERERERERDNNLSESGESARRERYRKKERYWTVENEKVNGPKLFAFHETNDTEIMSIMYHASIVYQCIMCVVCHLCHLCYASYTVTFSNYTLT